MLKNIFKKVKNTVTDELITKSSIYRIVDIVENDKGQFKAIIQLVGKNDFFEMKPEEILSDDKMTESFHQHDIRLLTYLGYCGINTPQYKILAKKLLANENIELAIYDNKSEKFSIKNLDDIATNDEIMIKNLTQQDAYDLGFAHGRKSILDEKNVFKNQL